MPGFRFTGNSRNTDLPDFVPHGADNREGKSLGSHFAFLMLVQRGKRSWCLRFLRH